MEEVYNAYLSEKINDSFGGYAIYLRKSRADVETEARGEGETLARHEKMLLDLAEKMGIKIDKIYREIVSGETIEARPEIQKLLSDVKKGMWKGVLVVEVERLARGETMDQGIVAKAFKISDTKIITPMKTYDPNDEFDEEYFEFGLFMSRREYKTINRRLQRGRVSSVNEGKYVGSVAPYGYERVKIKGDKGYTLRKNSESNTVKIIYDLYAYENLSLHEVVKRINEMGLRPRKNDKWCVASVKDILANPVYIGKVKWNWRKEVRVYKNEKLIKTRPRNDEYILKDGLHKAIIDDRTWKIVEAKRSLNKLPIPRVNTVQNPLCGLVYCAKCGKKMKRRPYTDRSKEPTIYCDNPKCDNISSKLHFVEEKVIEGLRKWLEHYQLDYKEHIEKINCSRIESIEDTIKSLQEEVKKENDKLLNIFNFLEDEINVTIANPKWVKAVKGNKDDTKDSKWIGDLFRLGLVRGSYIPCKKIRILRKFTRYRYKLVSCRSSEKNRYQNALTVCNVALDSVVSDVLGKSSTSIIDYLLGQSGTSIDHVNTLVPGTLTILIF